MVEGNQGNIKGVKIMAKIKLNEMRKLLDASIALYGIDSEHVLNVSKQLDNLILEFYLKGLYFCERDND